MRELAYKTNVYAKRRFRIHIFHDVYARMAKRIHILMSTEKAKEFSCHRRMPLEHIKGQNFFHVTAKSSRHSQGARTGDGRMSIGVRDEGVV